VYVYTGGILSKRSGNECGAWYVLEVPRVELGLDNLSGLTDKTHGCDGCGGWQLSWRGDGCPALADGAALAVTAAAAAAITVLTAAAAIVGLEVEAGAYTRPLFSPN
jgi:hypothetical protein